MLPPMEDQAEIDAFLNRSDPPLLGVVGTIDEDGSPHVVPVWYRYDGQAVYIGLPFRSRNRLTPLPQS